MKPVDQTTFGKDEGDCFAACLATVLELSLSEIPDLRGPEQFDTMMAWLWQRNLTAVELDLRPRAKPPYLFKSFGLKGHGLAIVSGKSPRGEFEHSIVVCVDQHAGQVQFVHDPHPSRAWLEDIQAVMFILPYRLRHKLAAVPLSTEATRTGAEVF